MKVRILKLFPLFLVVAVLLSVGLILLTPQPTQAQCGSSASSCKSCHETEGQHPVNTLGEWHSQHAFGDFCEFCHAGNVQATEKEAAHQGLVAPLEDVAASCQGCHPQDLMERGEKYAALLGVTLGDGGSGSGEGNAGSSDDGTDCAPVTTAAAPLGGEEIDFNLLYTEAITPEPLIQNWGNVVLLVMLAGLAIAFFLTAWTWEGWGRLMASWIRNNFTVIPDAVIESQASSKRASAASASAELASLLERKPELRELWPKLAKSDSRVLKAIAQILSESK